VRQNATSGIVDLLSWEDSASDQEPLSETIPPVVGEPHHETRRDILGAIPDRYSVRLANAVKYWRSGHLICPT
jgi:hypothetical protein